MALTVKHSFEVQAPIDSVWAYFAEPPQVVSCIPGAELLEVSDQKTYLGRVGIRLGQINMKLEGKVRIVEIDAEQRTMLLVAGGDQVGAPGGAEADINFSLQEVGDVHTNVNILADISVSGKLAQMGGGMVQTVGKFMFGRFSKCVCNILDEEISIELPEKMAADQNFFQRVWQAIRGWVRKLFKR